MWAAPLVCVALSTAPAGIGDKLPSLLLDVTNKAIPGTISAKNTKYRAPATVILEDVELRDKKGAKVAEIRRMKAVVEVTPLLSGNVVVSTLEIDEPRLYLVMDNGRLNIERALVDPAKSQAPPDPNEKKTDIDIRVNGIDVSDAYLEYKDPGNLTVKAYDVSSKGRVEVFVGLGKVFVRGEYWNADAAVEIASGEAVEVTAVDGMRLQVRRARARD